MLEPDGLSFKKGSIVLQDGLTGVKTVLVSEIGVLTGITRDEVSGVFYIANETSIYSYDPCNKQNIRLIGNLNLHYGEETIRAIAYKHNVDKLYAIKNYNPNSFDYYLKIDLPTLTINRGSPYWLLNSDVESIEFDENDVAYMTSERGILVLNGTSEEEYIASNVGNFGCHSIAFDPNDNNIIYISGCWYASSSTWKINKVTQSITPMSSLNFDTLFSGMYLLDQQDCTAVTDCPPSLLSLFFVFCFVEIVSNHFFSNHFFLFFLFFFI